MDADLFQGEADESVLEQGEADESALEESAVEVIVEQPTPDAGEVYQQILAKVN